MLVKAYTDDAGHMNPARANPDWYELYNNRIIVKGTKPTIASDPVQSVMGVMFGLSMTSNVTEMIVSRIPGETKYLKEISITPVAEEFERALAFYGELLGSPIWVNSFKQQISFTTRISAATAGTARPYGSRGSGECLYVRTLQGTHACFSS